MANPVNETWSQVRKRIECALCNFLMNESELLKSCGFERPSTHRLAIYLDAEFKNEWDVDCEFGKAEDTSKLVTTILENKGVEVGLTEKYLEKLLRNEKIDLEKCQSIYYKSAIPDIIVHHRGRLEDDHNLLFIEAKFNDGPNDLDRLKLLAFTYGAPQLERKTRKVSNKRILRYRLGLFLNLPQIDNVMEDRIKKTVTARVFAGGKELTKFEPGLEPSFEINVPNRALEKTWRLNEKRNRNAERI